MAEPRLNLLDVRALAEQGGRTGVPEPVEPEPRDPGGGRRGTEDFVGQVPGVKPRAGRAGEPEFGVSGLCLLAVLPKATGELAGQAEAGMSHGRLGGSPSPLDASGTVSSQSLRPHRLCPTEPWPAGG
jgi:hypothetical protein